MSQSISLTTGSILNGSPITIQVIPFAVTSGTPSVHRIILEIECGMTGGNYETLKMSQPVLSETGSDSSRAQTIDISSALRTFRDSYIYTHLPCTYPVVKFNIKYYDEYVINGDLNTTTPIYYPKNPWGTSGTSSTRDDTAYLRTIFGAFTDMERLTAPAAKAVQTLTRKPSSLPEIVAVGETYAYTPAYTSAQQLATSTSLTGPTSVVKTISASDIGTDCTDGTLSIGGHSLYALPSVKAADRQVFRFINGFGVLESVSVPRVYQKQVDITSEPYIIARQETLNTFSRYTVRKQNNRETWQFSTDPLDELWMSWYIHEFLMAEHVWMQIGNNWVRCTITPEEETILRNDTERTMYSLAFSVQLDMNGSPIL